jgi:hypothetical protein
MVIEVASNDGYLLKNFVSAGIPCLGIEPTDSTAEASEKLGIPVLREFFGEELGKKLSIDDKQADLIIGNNVYAHVPDINDFTKGLKAALKHNGTITLEFPHLMHLISNNQFDTIYHEHFSYLSLYTVNRIFETFGLRIFDVEELPTHGGSLRVFGCHENDSRQVTEKMNALLDQEKTSGLQDLETYTAFQKNADKIKDDLLAFLSIQKASGKRIVGYGAAAKGNTLLNYCKIKGTDIIEYVVDKSASKQDKFLPGSRIPIYSDEMIRTTKPDLIIIFPWNIKEEVCQQLYYVKEWGASFVVAVPNLQVLK